MYNLNILCAIKNMTIKELKRVFCDNYYRQIGFSKENSYCLMKHQKKKDLLLLATKLTEKIPDVSNAKKYYKSYLKRKNTKFIKQSNIITQQAKTTENLNIVDIKAVIIEHSKTSLKLSKTIRQAEKFFK